MFSMIRLLLVFCYLMLEYAPLTSACLIWLGVAWWLGGDTSTPLWCLLVAWLVTRSIPVRATPSDEVSGVKVVEWKRPSFHMTF